MVRTTGPPRTATTAITTATKGMAIQPVSERTQIGTLSNMTAASVTRTTIARRGPRLAARMLAPRIGGASNPPAARSAAGRPGDTLP
jgi:hypothetical protein